MNIGKKASMAIRVAPNRGIAVFLPIVVRASFRGLPILKSTNIPSIMTMALSTSIPIANMNVANDTRCIDPSNTPRNRNEPITIVRRLTPMITPLRNPIVSINMTKTIIMDSIKFTKNDDKASVTLSG